MIWYDLKLWLLETLNLDKDALHIYVALTIQFVTAAVIRRSLANPWPWLAAFTVALLNEYFDYQGVGETEASIAYYQAAAWHDMWNTMLLPTLFLLLARYLPGLLTDRFATREKTVQDSQQSRI